MDIEEAINALDEALAAEESGQPNPLTKEQDTTPDPVPAPEVSAKAEPITEENVAPSKDEEPTAPDSTILRDRLQALASPKSAAPEEDPREAEVEQLRRAVQALSANKVADPVAFLQQQTGLTPEQLIQKQHAPESLAQKAIEEARAAREEQARLRQELEDRERERQLEDLRNGVTSFVQSKNDEYVVTNKSNNQELVFALMHQSLGEGNPLSEVEAAAQVESKLQDFINAHAPLLGWKKSDETTSSHVDEPRTEESKTLNPQSASATPSKSWDEMSFEEREKEALRLL